MPASATSARHSPSRPLNSATTAPLAKPHHRKQVMRLILRQGHGLPLTKGLIYKETNLRYPWPAPYDPTAPNARGAQRPQRHRRRCPARQLGRYAGPRRNPPLPAPVARGPAHRHMAVVAALPVGHRAGRRQHGRLRRCATSGLRPRSGIGRLPDARRGLHLERHHRPRHRRRRRAHPITPDPVGSGHASNRRWSGWPLQALIAAAILFTYHPLAIALGIGSLALVAIYPFAKRFTWWPQVFLGLAFNWGALLALGRAYRQPGPCAPAALRRRHRLDAVLRHDLCPSGPRG